MSKTALNIRRCLRLFSLGKEQNLVISCDFFHSRAHISPAFSHSWGEKKKRGCTTDHACSKRRYKLHNPLSFALLSDFFSSCPSSSFNVYILHVLLLRGAWPYRQFFFLVLPYILIHNYAKKFDPIFSCWTRSTPPLGTTVVCDWDGTLITNPYVNEVTLRRQKPPLKCC